MPNTTPLTLDYSLLEGEYLNDLLDQPHALSRTRVGLKVNAPLRQVQERLAQGEFRTIVLTGMGSSFHALHGLQLKLHNAGYAALALETSELLYYHQQLLGPKTLLVAVSQSGRSVELVRLLEANKGRSAVIGVTNTADSPLATRSDAVVLTDAGEESTVSCKTYVAGLIALEWLGAVLLGGDLVECVADLDRACPLVEEYLRDWRDHVRALATSLNGVHNCYLAGRGASLASVGTGALITKEAAHFPSEGLSSAAFRHGPAETAGDNIYVMVFEGDAATSSLNIGLRDYVRAQGGRSGLVGVHSEEPALRLPEAPAGIVPVLEILPVQMMTLALAALAGRKPGVFQRATKVTSVE